jgi:hypothetical protein
MDLPSGYSTSTMRWDEVAQLEKWAAAEGWNPGLADLNIVWETNAESFVALREGTLPGGRLDLQ